MTNEHGLIFSKSTFCLQPSLTKLKRFRCCSKFSAITCANPQYASLEGYGGDDEHLMPYLIVFGSNPDVTDTLVIISKARLFVHVS